MDLGGGGVGECGGERNCPRSGLIECSRELATGLGSYCVGKMMAEDVAIALRNVSKCFKRYAKPSDRLKEFILPRKGYAQEFWALQDINLEVRRGETLGIIGQNGSGKSTLLQIVAGTLTPTTGNVIVKGRVSALLELGSGFNPEFTGRQNVYFNGQILGLSQTEIATKLDEILEFAEIGDFIDQPVKTYSSGMVVRLAFAVIANTEPSVLIVDEALAVGDARFQARCMKRIRSLQEQGVTLLFVSHDASSVKALCKTAVLIEHGRILEAGSPKDVVNRYIALLSSDQSSNIHPPQLDENKKSADHQHTHTPKAILDPDLHRHGNKLAVIQNVQITDLNNKEISHIETGDFFRVIVSLEIRANLSDLIIGISLRNLMGLVVYGINTKLLDLELPQMIPGCKFSVNFEIPCHLNKGIYNLTIGLHSEENISYDWIDEVALLEVSNNQIAFDGFINLQSTARIMQKSFNSKQ
jgi:lipopolysaccharide transport system ATP-binding protein